MAFYYILDSNNEPVGVDSYEEYRAFLLTRSPDGRPIHVGSDVTEDQRYWVSTVFLGIDHSFSEDGPPVLFETMVFLNVEEDETDPSITTGEIDGNVYGMRDQYMQRYCTWPEAFSGHWRVVNLLNNGGSVSDLEKSDESEGFGV